MSQIADWYPELLDAVARGCREQHWAPLKMLGKWDELEPTVHEHYRREACRALDQYLIERQRGNATPPPVA